jgi:hypothetical protein
MEFIPRGETRPSAPAAQSSGGRHKRFDWNGRAVRIEWFIFTALVALVLLTAIGWLIWSNSNNGNGESSYINSSKYQAVFLNGGATSGSVAYTTYFGHITKLTSSYMILQNVYYLTTSSTGNNQSVNPQLTKLGCQQLHSPYDEMVINRSQVAFWENLQDSGKVVQAIKTFQQQNPNGPNCSSSSDSTNSTTNTQTTTPTNSSNSTKP